MEPSTEAPNVSESNAPKRKGFIQSEDWLAVLLGAIILGISLGATAMSKAPDFKSRLEKIDQAQVELKNLEATAAVADTESRQKQTKATEKQVETLTRELYKNPLKPWFSDVESWKADPTKAFFKDQKSILPGVLGVFGFLLALFSISRMLQRESIAEFIGPFSVLFLLAIAAYVLAGQEAIKYSNLEFALWAILIGMVISNTVGTPNFVRPALQTELYIKTGLILLGAETLLSKLLVLGLPGICVSWIVTPITLIGTYVFGQYVLRIPSKSLNMVISADMSVCGVSAAIATASACRAKKEELSLAIGISLAFTAIMMVVMPKFIQLVGMKDVIAGAWIGGTIDSSGAVAAAGAMLSPTAMQVAITVKMIQNILIGVVSFGVALYWVTYVENTDHGPRPGIGEIWRRFPRFVLGFVGASMVFSAIYSGGIEGKALADAATSSAPKLLRGWLFCLAFVSIGLESDFRKLSHYLKGGKAVILYVCGQTLNLTLTLFMAWLMFEVVFPNTAQILSR